MRRLIVITVLFSIILVSTNGCIPATQSWVKDYTNRKVNMLILKISTVNDSVKALSDSLNSVSLVVRALSDSLENLKAIRKEISIIKIRIDTLEIVVDSVRHFQRQIVPAYLKTLRDIIDEYIQSTQDTL